MHARQERPPLLYLLGPSGTHMGLRLVQDREDSRRGAALRAAQRSQLALGALEQLLALIIEGRSRGADHAVDAAAVGSLDVGCAQGVETGLVGGGTARRGLDDGVAGVFALRGEVAQLRADGAADVLAGPERVGGWQSAWVQWVGWVLRSVAARAEV